MSHNIAELLVQRAAEDPGAASLHFGEEVFDFQVMASNARRIATWLDRDICEHGRIGVALPNSPDALHLIHACWWAGATSILINHTLSSGEIRNAVDDTKPAILVVRDDLAASLSASLDIPVLSISELWRVVPKAEDASRPTPVTVDVDTPAVVIFTSGSSGRPKGAVLSHGALMDATETLGRALRGRPGPYPVSSGSPTLIALPLAHTGGLCSWVFALYAGRTVVLLERFRVEEFERAVNDHGVEAVVATPTMLQMLTTAEGLSLPSLRSVQSTGAPLPPSIKERFEATFGLPIIENYGQTEALHVAGWTRDDLVNRTWRAGSVGRPYDGVEVDIIQEDGRSSEVRQVGEIVVRSEHLMSRYIDGTESEADRGEIDNRGFLHTGDLGYLDEDGYLYVVGRKREVLITGGFNVYPAEVENALLAHPDISEVVVVGVPDERLGEIPHAVVVARRPMTEDEVVTFCRGQIAHYKAVRSVTFVEELPRSESQKIRRQLVRQLIDQ